MSTAVARIEPAAEPYELKSPIAKLLKEPATMAIVRPLIPHGMDYNQVVSEVYRACVNDPKIIKCTPASIIDAVCRVIQTQLVVGRTIYLVPTSENVAPKGEPKEYVNKLQAWTHYSGDIELVQRSGAARLVDGHEVYTGDYFEVELGENPRIVHRPQMDPAKRGAIIGAYSIAYINQSGSLRKVTWVPIADIEKVRAKSKSWSRDKVGDCPYWYAIKTAIRRNCKTLPKNEKLAKVIALLDREDIEEQTAEPIEETSALRGGDDLRQLNAGAPESSAPEPGALATEAQKARIYDLLEHADLDAKSLDVYSRRGGSPALTVVAADELIAELEKLSPPNDSTEEN